MKNTLLSILFTCLAISSLGQRGVDYSDTDNLFAWKDFDGVQFIYTAAICAVVILIGYWLRAKFTNKIIKSSGWVIMVIGGLLSLAFLSLPILAALSIIWQVFVGVAIFGACIYFGTQAIDKDI